MPVQSRRVLICGAGIAGPALAYWLHRFGFLPTVVEWTPRPRVAGGGHAVDLFGPAVDLMSWMGVLGGVERVRTATRRITLVRPGHRDVELPADIVAEGVSDRHIEIMRGDLARILYEATRDTVEYLFDDSIASVRDDGQVVEVSFEHGKPESYDLLIGADGLHSRTRNLQFGPESLYLRFLGGYLATFTVPNHLGLTDQMLGLAATPGRTAAIYPIGDGSLARAVLLWRTPRPHEFDRHDPDAQRRLVANLYGDLGWEVPRLLAGLDQADDLYLDAISQVIMDSWTSSRVALVGDAGYSPGPAVGGGTSLAIIGAYVLATQLAAAGGDHDRGFAGYERAMAGVVQNSRRIGPATIKLLIPRTAPQIWFTAQAVRLLPHVPRPVRRRLTSFGGGPAAMLDEAHLTPPDDSAPQPGSDGAG